MSGYIEVNADGSLSPSPVERMLVESGTGVSMPKRKFHPVFMRSIAFWYLQYSSLPRPSLS